MAWLSGYSYRKSIQLSRASGAVSNYQMKLLLGESSGAIGEDVDCGGHCLSTFNDIRFTTSDGTTMLDYWIESVTGTTPNQLATIWIEFDSIGTGATTFYMYYGKADAAAASNGDNTFSFFDDFPGSSIDTNKWNVVESSTVAVTGGICTITGGNGIDSRIDTDTQWNANSAFRGKLKTAHYNSGSYREFGGLRAPVGAASDIFLLTVPCHNLVYPKHWAHNSVDESTSFITGGITADTYSIWDILRNGSTNAVFMQNGANSVTITQYVSDGNMGVHFIAGANTSAVVSLDWVLVRQYLATEPAWGSWGEEVEETELDAVIQVPVVIAGTMMKGLLGDIEGSITVPITLSGTLEAIHVSGTLEINSTIAVPVSISGTMKNSRNVINGHITIPVSISGTQYVYPVYTGLLDGSIPAMEMSASAIVDTIGNGCINIPALTMSATGLTSYVGNATITLPRLTVTASAMRTLIGAATLKLPALRTSASTLLGIVANGEITIPMLRVSADSYRSVIATATVTLPSLKLDAVHIPSSYINMVMNVRNAALTLYTNYSFNSLCHFDGKNLGATATGVYDLDLGDTDAGVSIDWNFKTGYLDLHLKTKKKLREAWLGCKASGDMIVTLTDTDGTAYEYEAKSYEETERGLRVKFGRGYHRRYLSMDVQNLDGGNITLDTIRLILDKYGGRR